MPLVSDEPTTATNESTSRPRGGDANAGNPVWHILRPVSVPIAVALLLQILGSLASAIPLRAMTRIVDGLTRGTDAVWPAVWWFIGGLGGALVLGSLALLITHLVDLRVQAGLREQLADKLSRLPLGWFDQSSSGRVRRIVQDDVATLHHLVAHALVEITAAVLTPVVGVIVALTIDWRLGLCCMIGPVAYMVLFSVLAPGDMRTVMARIAEALSEVSAAVIEFVDGIAVLRIFGAAETGSIRFTRASDDFTSEFRTLVTPQMRAHAVALTALGLPVVALTVVGPGAAMVAAGWSEVADVVVVTMIALSLPATLLTVGAGQQHVSDGQEAAARIVALLDEPELPVPQQPTNPPGLTSRSRASPSATHPTSLCCTECRSLLGKARLPRWSGPLARASRPSPPSSPASVMWTPVRSASVTSTYATSIRMCSINTSASCCRARACPP